MELDGAPHGSKLGDNDTTKHSPGLRLGGQDRFEKKNYTQYTMYKIFRSNFHLGRQRRQPIPINSIPTNTTFKLFFIGSRISDQ